MTIGFAAFASRWEPRKCMFFWLNMWVSGIARRNYQRINHGFHERGHIVMIYWQIILVDGFNPVWFSTLFEIDKSFWDGLKPLTSNSHGVDSSGSKSTGPKLMVQDWKRPYVQPPTGAGSFFFKAGLGQFQHDDVSCWLAVVDFWSLLVTPSVYIPSDYQ